MVEVGDDEIAAQRRALAAYETYREVIEEIDPASVTGTLVAYEFFGETHEPPLSDLTAALPARLPVRS